MLLAVENLQTHFRTPEGLVRAVDDVSFHLAEGETLAIVGESGCGKSTVALSILRLIPPSFGAIAGSVRLRGADLLTLGDRAMRRVRGKEIGMIFQDPSSSLNPVLTVGYQIVEIVRLNGRYDGPVADDDAAELLDRVGIPEARQCLRMYPHQLSGGLQQRVVFALALAGNPKLLIADEPTSALDVTLQAQILELIGELKRTGISVLLITHDMGVVAEVADRVMVMYGGRKIEEAPVRDLFHTPRHPNTKALLAATPRIAASRRDVGEKSIDLNRADGNTACVYASRCSLATDLCRTRPPELEMKAPKHCAACHYALREAHAA